jgi:N4-gp56 family major capsid protein
MSIETTSTLSNAVRTRYLASYLKAAKRVRLYDQLAAPLSALGADLERARGMGTTYTVNFLSGMTPGTTAISESADIVPQILRDATATITPTSRAEALQWSEGLELKAYTNYAEERFTKLGENMMETVDNLALAAALQGSLVSRYAARASLDAGTANHRWTDDALWKAASQVKALKCPPFMVNGRQMWLAIAHPDLFYDLLNGGDVNSVALYQDKEIILNGELGQLAGFKLIISPDAKIFGAAGAANGSAAATTLSAAVNALAVTATVAASTNTNVGRTLTIGTAETANTFYDDNEIVFNTTASASTTITFAGQAANGGLRFDHASGTAVSNADNVYPVAYGTPGSLVKVYAKEVGAFGEVVGPKKDGIVDQFATVGWKWYGGYGRVAESYILRGEYSTSLQA